MNTNALAPMFVARGFLPGMIGSGEECRSSPGARAEKH